jgi:hypothetical protein
MFDPEILGWPSLSWVSLAQTLLTPALGFVFLFLMGLPLTKFSWVQGDAKYTPPGWVLPLFALGSVFVIVAAFSAYVFANYRKAPDLSREIKSELFLTRELATADALSDVTVALKTYDGFSHFRVFVNGYHVLSTTRDCVATFQCRPQGDEMSIREVAAFYTSTRGRGSVYDLGRMNRLGEQISLKHYLVAGQNHIDVISENAATGGCELTAEIALKRTQDSKSHLLRVVSHGGAEPPRSGALQPDELFHAGGTPSHDALVERYKTSRHERRGAVCERIRVVLTLTDAQAAALSTDQDFAWHFITLQRDYICATIGAAIPRCEAGP